MERLDILGLKAFISVAEQGSFRTAATYLNLSSTAVSRRVQKLEEALGVLLISRTTRRVTLTRLGAEFLPRAQEMLSTMEVAFNELRDRGRFGDGSVTVGCLPTIASYCLPDILAAYVKRYASSRVQVFDVSATEILERVRSDRVDFGISFIGAEHYDLTIEPLFSEPIVALMKEGTPLSAKRGITWDALSGSKLISIGQLSGTRRLIESSLKAHEIELDWAFEVQHLTTAVFLAQAGVGVAILPAIAARLMPSRLVAVELTDPQVFRSIGLIRRNDLPLSPNAKRLKDIVAQRLRR